MSIFLIVGWCASALVLSVDSAPSAGEKNATDTGLRQQTSIAIGSRAEYVALSTKAGERPPITRVNITVGPGETIKSVPHYWWEMSITAAPESPGADVVVHALTNELPLRALNAPVHFSRYQVSIPATRETLEYVDAHTGDALLPPWNTFNSQFTPRAVTGTATQQGFPETCRLLGQVLTLHQVEAGEWHPFEAPTRLQLDRELSIGTARNFREKENGRLPNAKQQDYTYAPFVEADYKVMLEAGTNLFCVNLEQESFVRGKPVFYLRRPEKRKKNSKEPLYRFPADLYRSNLLGTEMFFDEPAIILTFDEYLKNEILRGSDAIALMQGRIRAADGLSRSLERTLASGLNLGELTIQNTDYPSWETLYYTAFYQMQAGLAGFVQEGHYRLDGFDRRIARWTGKSRVHTVDEMLRYQFAFLRGGTRPFGKDWGTAIYGQADPAVTPRAVTLAYDMGARYIWFWTSDHEHHLPWSEQVELTRTVTTHARAHPRESIRAGQKMLDLAIVVPYGTLISLDDITWIRDLRPGSPSPEALRHRLIMQRAHIAIDAALAAGDDFDITFETGHEITGYKRIVRISDAP